MIAECTLCGCEEQIQCVIRHPAGHTFVICTHCIDQFVALRMGDDEALQPEDAADTAQAVSRFIDLRMM